MNKLDTIIISLVVGVMALIFALTVINMLQVARLQNSLSPKCQLLLEEMDGQFAKECR